MRSVKWCRSPRSPESSGNPRSTWTARLFRGRRFDRNPLRRRTDRAETAFLGLLLAVFLAGASLAAHAAGSWTYTMSAREAQVQRTVTRHVPATLLQAALPWNPNEDGAYPEAQARWRAPGGEVRTGSVVVPGGAPKGSATMVWVNQAGQLSDPPLQPGQIQGRVDLAQGFAVGALAIMVVVIGWLTRRALDQRRMTAWDADWLANGPRWSPRR